MIVKIRTKASGEMVFLWIMSDNEIQFIEPSEIPLCIEQTIYENPFIEIYLLRT